MIKTVLKLLIIISIFIINISGAHAAFIIKIHGLEFDNSDNIVGIKSEGMIYPKTRESQEDDEFDTNEPQNVIAKGYLTEPERVFIDISNAILTDNQKTYVMKNSFFENVKISQHSTEPNIVRIVFTSKNKINPLDFKIFANNRQIFMQYKKEMIQGKNFKSIYNNLKEGEKGLEYFESTSYLVEKKQRVTDVSDDNNELLEQNTDNKEQEKEETSLKDLVFKTVVSEPKMTRFKSSYYLHGIQEAKNGILLKGAGTITLKNSLFITQPNRLIVDLENANLAQELRNTTHIIPTNQNLVDEDGKVSEPDRLRIGQNTPSTVRLVLEGDNISDYRFVISPDMQGLFIARRLDVLNSKLTQIPSRVLSYTGYKLEDGTHQINIKFSNPVALTMFEQFSNFYLDLQNVDDFNPLSLVELNKHPDYKGISAQKIALEKSRIVFNLADSTKINAKISPDSRELRIYFKKREKEIVPDKQPVVAKKPDTTVEEKPIKPSTIKGKYTVVIDAGHGGLDPGAVGGKIYEKDLVLSISKQIEANLKEKGVFTYMTRDRDKFLELKERTDFANAKKPDVFISVHINSTVKDSIKGFETHWYHENGLELARTVHSKFASSKNLKSFNTIDRGLFRSKFYVINHTKAPAILVEIGYISNSSERKKLTNEERQEEIAKSIADGIMEYLK